MAAFVFLATLVAFTVIGVASSRARRDTTRDSLTAAFAAYGLSPLLWRPARVEAAT